MAPADRYSAPGAARYDSDTMQVGDGTWDFEKNTFLLPNLAGLDFDTMRYNGMGNRFSTVAEYHNLIRAHAVMGALVFLGLVPAAVFLARFYTRAPGYARHYHGIINGFAVLILTPVFILGWFAVGPARSWSNPHHVIGLAVYVMYLLQLIGGRIVRNIPGVRPSLRLTIHQWSGRLIALLGIVQVPLGLTLYGSPSFTFILFAVWMALLLLAYFVLDFRAKRYRDFGGGVYASGARSEGPPGTESEFRTERTEIREEEKSGLKRWLAPLLAAGGLFAFLSRRKANKNDRSRSGSPSRRGPEVIPSRRGSSSYVEEEKYTDMDSRRGGNATRTGGGGGFLKGLFAGRLLSGAANRRKEPQYADGYSAVSTETPPRKDRYGRRPGAVSEYSDYTVDARRNAGTESLLPPPGNPVMAAHAMSAAEERHTRPMTPTRPSHVRTQSGYGMEPSDYSSYVSPSRRPRDQQGAGRVAAAGGGILATVGLGWLAKRWADRKRRREEDRRLREEEDLRSGVLSSRYTGDGYSSPSRVGGRKPSGHRPPPASTLGTSVVTGYTEDSSSRLEDRPGNTRHGGPPMPPLQAGNAPPQHVSMPPMPPDPQGVLHHRDYSSDAYSSPSRRPSRRGSERRRRAGERAAAAAAASAASTAAEAEEYRRADASRRGEPVAVKVRVHDDKDRNVTLRRLTEEEAAASRRDQARRRNDSLGSMSGTESPGRMRYRRDSSQRRAEQAAESAVSSVPPPPPMGGAPPPPPLTGSSLPPGTGLPPGTELPPLSPPHPAFAGGRRPQKDSAYYSSQPAPPATPVGQPLEASVIGSPESHGTWSGMSPSPSGPTNAPAGSAAADNRRRRRLERRRSTSRRPTGADMFD